MTNRFATVRELIDRQALARPDDVFLIAPETSATRTFAEMQQAARQIASVLGGRGLTRGDRVAFLLENGIDAVELLLGIMYGGFVAVPLNATAGPAQLDFMLQHCEAKIVIRSPDQLTAAATKLMDAAPTPDDAALLIYTSGTTGTAKGAMISQRALLAGARNGIDAYRLTAADRTLCVLPLFHISAPSMAVIGTLSSGGSLVMARRFSVSTFWNLVDTWKCTWFTLVPNLVTQLLGTVRTPPVHEHVRFARSVSAALPPAQQQAFEAKFNIPLLESLGSTEAGLVFSQPAPSTTANLVRKPGSPGVAWNCEIRIVNEHGKDVTAGQPGEILVRGPSLMSGYFKDEPATRRAIDSAGWLHTGDIGRLDHDGHIFLVGRGKEFINKCGEKIAPREIDEMLARHPAVLEAGSAGIADQFVGEEIVAFVVRRTGQSVSIVDLLDWCRQNLGPLKTPAEIHFVDSLPRGATGKVQRAQITAWFQQHKAPGKPLQLADEAAGSEEPATPTEELVQTVMSDLLGGVPVRVHDNLFELGGDSLVAAGVVARFAEVLGVQTPIRLLFEAPTVAELSRYVDEQRHSQRGLQYPPLQRVPRTGPLPLSYAQQQLWKYACHEGCGYTVPRVFRFLGPLDHAAFNKALSEMVRRHECFRTHFVEKKGSPWQVIAPPAALPMPVIDLRRHKAPDAEVEKLIVEEARRPFNLARDWPIRVQLLQVAAEHHVALITTHHIVVDAISKENFYRELGVLYDAFVEKRPSPFADLPLQAADHAVWQRYLLQKNSALYKQHLAHWFEQMRGVAELRMPFARPAPLTTPLPPTAGQHSFVVDAELSDLLRRLAQRHKSTMFMLLLAAVKVCFQRATGQHDILLGSYTAGRNHAGLENMLGCFVNKLPLRTRLSGAQTFADVLERVRTTALYAFSYQDLPFELLVEELASRKLPYPVLSAIFEYRSRPSSTLAMKGIQVGPYGAGRAVMPWGCSIYIRGDKGALFGGMAFDAQLYDPAGVAEFLADLHQVLRQIAANPHASVLCGSKKAA